MYRVRYTFLNAMVTQTTLLKLAVSSKMFEGWFTHAYVVARQGGVRPTDHTAGVINTFPFYYQECLKGSSGLH